MKIYYVLETELIDNPENKEDYEKVIKYKDYEKELSNYKFIEDLFFKEFNINDLLELVKSDKQIRKRVIELLVGGKLDKSDNVKA